MPIGRSTATALLRVAFALGLSLPAFAEAPEQTLSRATESEGAKTSRVILVCPKEALLTVELLTSDPAKPAIVRTPDGAELSLPAQSSGSSDRDADDTHELRGKDCEASWTDGSKPPNVCTEETPAIGGSEPK